MMNGAPLTAEGTAEVIVKLRSKYWGALVTIPVVVVPQSGPPGHTSYALPVPPTAVELLTVRPVINCAELICE
jgi:hypothetical protein